MIAMDVVRMHGMHDGAMALSTERAGWCPHNPGFR